MERSDRLSLAYLMADQASKHVTVNETFRMLDALVQLSVRSRTVTDEPAAPVPGDAYILPAGKSGATWDGFGEGAVATFQDNAWTAYPPTEGMTAFVADEGGQVVWDGSAWISAGGEQLQKLGVNTSPDTSNKLAVKSDQVLFSHDDVTPGTGDLRMFFNKAEIADTASLIFQTAFSGRVELGLTGSDDFTFRVSANGTDFIDAIVIDHETGAVSFPNTTDLGGSTSPDWVPSGASFAISAEEEAIWIDGAGPNSNLLSPAGASFTGGTNSFVESGSGIYTAASGGAPRRSYDAAETLWGYATGADVPVFANGAPVPPALLGTGLSYDFVVDPITGDDGNSGAPGAPLATLTGLQSAVSLASSGSTLAAYIHAADYVDEPFQTSLDDKTLTLVFEPGATIRSTETGVGTTQCIDVVSGSLTIYGNGLHIRDWQGLEELGTDDYQNSSNGLAAHGTGTLIVHDTKVSNCGDGLTAHATSRIEAYRCWIEDCDKYAVVHVDSSTSYQEDCVIIGGDGHGGTDVRDPTGIIGAFGGSAGDHEFVRCRFLPSPSRVATRVDGNNVARLQACHLGDLTQSVDLRDVHVTDSFLNAEGDLSVMTEPLTRCYGYLSLRLREGGSAVPVLTDCVFVGKAANSSRDSFLYTNFTPASYGEITVTDCVITGYDLAIDLERAEAPGLWQASGSLIDSCTFHGNTDDFGINAAGEVDSTITNSMFTDPGLGSHADSLAMADFAASVGSDGFTSGEAEVTGPPVPEDDDWTYGDASALGLSNGQNVRFTATDDASTEVTVTGGSFSVPPGHWKLIHGPV